MRLENLGWDSARAEAFARLAAPAGGAEPGRVVKQEGALLRVRTASDEIVARAAPALVRAAGSGELLPAIGDWVGVSRHPDSGEEGAREGRIELLLPRKSALIRRAAGQEGGAQVIAANVDVIFVVQALDRPVHPRRIERALALAWNSGASPVLVLSKTDASPDPAGALEAAAAVALGAPVLGISARTGEGLEALRAELPPRTTGVLLGLSGAGKSTLVNRLLGEERLATSEVRRGDQKGRHTTTRRELIELPGGGMLIDGPGMRAFGLWGDDTGIERAFADVETLAESCRFRDCGHGTEPGCAVRGAVEAGTLEVDRVRSYDKLRAELAATARASNAAATAAATAAAKRARKRLERSATLGAWERSRGKGRA